MFARNATKEEIADFQKVEALLTEQEIDTINDVLDDFQTFCDFIDGKVTNKQIKAIMEAHDITEKELTTWYFVEPED